MKKLIATIAALALLLSFAACGAGKTDPTAEPTVEPTVEPTAEPTVKPTEEPAVEPTEEPTEEPAPDPTEEPAPVPTQSPAPTQQPENGGSEAGTDVQADTLALLTKIWGCYGGEEFPIAGGDYEHSVDDAPGAFDFSDPANLDYMLGLPESAAGLIDGAASLMHMMNTNSFTCGAFHAAQSENVSAIADALNESIMGRQWMCGFPDRLVIMTVGDYVVSFFGYDDLVESFKAAVTAAYSDAQTAYDAPIE